MVGYEYLHGTNADVGGFQVIGEARLQADRMAQFGPSLYVEQHNKTPTSNMLLTYSRALSGKS